VSVAVEYTTLLERAVSRRAVWLYCYYYCK